MGWNSQSTRPIVFENVRVPAANLLGNEGDGFKIAMKGLDGGRINIGTCSVGAAQGALDAARRYMDERRQFNRRLAEFQALQFKLADMATHLVAARQMVRLAACKLDGGAPDAATYCAMASASRPTWASRSAWMRNRYTAATATCGTIPWSVWCAILAYIRFWRDE